MAQLLLLAALFLAFPCLVLAIECLLALLPARSFDKGRRPRVAVLVPAHDEEAIVGGTVDHLRARLEPGDRLVVIADNCTDRTAELARAHGAEVVTRIDPERRGKGHALAFGACSLAGERCAGATRLARTDPPEVVVVVDADCRIGDDALDALARTVAATGRPAQGEYLLAPRGDSPLASLSALAFLVRNRARPRGLARVGGPCQLTGSGMAFPFALLSTADRLGSNLVEDLVLGIELTYRGHPPLLCSDARIEGELPTTSDVAIGQRRRWEHGHLATLFRHGPRLLGHGLAARSPASILLGLDLLVPPLSLLVLVELAAMAIAAIAAVTQVAVAPLVVLAGSLSLLGLALLLVWARFGRASIPARHLLAIPLYVAWKLPLYVAFLLRRQETRWIRTTRDTTRG